MRPIKTGSLKCVVLASPGDRAAAMGALIDRVGADDVRAYGAAAILVHTEEAAAAVRDLVTESDGAIVMEFETWSGSGDAVPREWLLSRGH
jgi:stage V sporulation protein SpoVS